jgi:F-type H+-transporting ATPase subunit b
LKRLLLALSLAAMLSFAQEPKKQHEVGVPNQTTAREVEESRVNETNELVWKWVNFAIFAGGLGYLAVKYGGPFFRSRTEEIRKGIEAAAIAKAEAEAQAARIEEKIKHLGVEIDELRHSSHEEMQAEGERIRKDTAAEIAKIQARAEQEIASAAKLAMYDLKAYSAHLAVNLAEQQIRNRMNPQTQERLVQQFVNELDGSSKAAVT